MIINGFYGLDILLNFRTTYYDDDGKEITNGLMVAWHYIKTGLVLDILTMLPFEELFPVKGNSKKFLKMISVVKGTRIGKLRTVIYRLDIKDEVKALYSIVIMFLYFVIYVHCSSCLFFYLISLDKTWIPIIELDKHRTNLWLSG